VLSPKDANVEFVQRAVQGVSLAHVLLVLDSKSLGSEFGFNASEIMSGRQAVEQLRKEIRARKKLCNELVEWGQTVEKIAQIAEMRRVDKIVLNNAENKPHFDVLRGEIQKHTQIPVEVV
jgi:hypothetical protein